ncbi:MAG TPA: type II secretion system F family protein [Clostridia bacterium]|nr:type II secretion system F family protein [Clostridia bacterium]
MAFFLTPGQFSRRADLYYQVGQLMSAGITLPAALEHLHQHPPARSYRKPLQQLCLDLDQGLTFTDALQQLDWLPQFDLALIRAGEQSGRLDACLRSLADYYTDKAAMARQVIGDLIYPAVLLHAAVFLFPFPQLFLTGNLVRYLIQTLGFLLPIYILIAVIVFAGQARHGEPWRALMEKLTSLIPVLGTARRSLAIARLSMALESLLNAGVTIIEAWELAGNASGSPALRRAILAWRPLVDSGNTPAEVVTASGKFPDLFVGQYSAGEISGSLTETLARLHRYYQEEGSRKLHAFARWTPHAIYLLIVFAIAYRVISFYAGYFRQIQNVF